ncbi:MULTISPECIES: hypothetical protein [unclassified Caballeronia]|uniref:hypothetical protein n=1 Tax=unclassified Caballeronia TaxID=2646786 RepID=UPI0028661AD0|nr:MULTISPECIES: hypothetical protein [unclassified Caballeronia]MDR5772909.1 hypothetical protein [Caballeronia sp. LZ002]MDR5848343.1 hypothetical protein [Caballeronia sp. LZ003]
MTDNKVLRFERRESQKCTDARTDDLLNEINTFDYDDYFDRASDGELHGDEKNEWVMRILELFCRDFFRNGGNPSKVPPWVMSYIARQIFKVLDGEQWERAFPLPWAQPDPYGNFTRCGKRAFDVWTSVRNALKQNPKAKVSHLLQAESARHNLSYEAVRGDYYAMKNGIEQGIGIPKKFLKIDDET